MLTARITEEQEEFLKELGDGNRTAGLHLLLKGAMSGLPIRGGTPAKAKPSMVPATPMSHRRMMVGKRR